MDRTIKTTIAVDGEKKFKDAITAANKSISNMGSELKLASAKFKNTNDAMALMKTRSEVLKKEIKQQTEIVKAMESAVKDSAAARGEDSAQTEKWQAELNRAKAKLEELNHELSNNEKGLDRNGKSFRQAGEKAESAGGLITTFKDAMNGAADAQFDFKSFDTAIGNIENRLKTVAKMFVNIGKGAWDMVADSAGWADDLKTLSDQTGFDVETLQSWEYASKFVDTELSTIVADVTKILSKASDGSKETQKQFNQLSVVLRDSSGELRPAQDIFWDTIDALGKIENESTRDALAMKLFGKSAKELNPLIKAGSKEWNQYAQEAKDSGYILEKDAVDSLGAFDDAINKMNASVEAAKNIISAELAPAMTTIADSFTKLITEFDLWAQSEEGQKALKGLSDAIGNVVTSLTGEVDFSELVGKATEAIEKLGGAFQWAADHPEEVIDKVKDALKVIEGVAITRTAIEFMEVTKNLTVAAGKGTGAVKGIIDKITGGLTTVGGISIKESVLSFLGKVGSIGGPAVLAAAGITAVSAALDQVAAERKFAWLDDLQQMDAGISEEGVKSIRSGIERGIREGIAAANVKDEIGEGVAKTYAEESYEIVKAGYGSYENVGGAIAYIRMQTEAREEEAKAARAAAEEARTKAQAEAIEAGEMEKAAAAQEEYNRAVEEANRMAEEAKKNQNEMISEMLMGAAGANGVSAEEMNQYADSLEKLAIIWRAMDHIDNGGAIYKADEWGAATDELEDAVEAARELMGYAPEEYIHPTEVYDSLINAMESAMQDVTEKEKDMGWMAGIYQQMMEGGDLDGIDMSQASGVLLAAFRRSLIDEAAGEDNILSRDEILQLMESDAYLESGKNAAEGMAEGIRKNSDIPGDAAGEMGKDTLEGLESTLEEKSPSRATKRMGKYLAQGLANGIYEDGKTAIRAAQWLADAVESTMRNAMQIHSPSRVMEEIGGYISIGLARGMEEEIGTVIRATNRMIEPVTSPWIGGSGSAAGGGRAEGGAGEQKINAVIVMDGQEVGYLVADAVNERIGARIESMRR